MFGCLSGLAGFEHFAKLKQLGRERTQGFAAFGRVVKGMEAVRSIQASPADGQHLTPPIVIRSARRIP